MTYKRPKIFAHRGGRVWALENSMDAFQRSMTFGVDGIELDVQRCKSGELVVIHDCEIAVGGTTRFIKDLTWTELQGRVPLLEDVLKLVDGKAVLNIEIKNVPEDYPGIEDDLLTLLTGYAHRATVIISAFDHVVLKRVSAKAPDLRLAVLANALPLDLPDYAKRCGATVWHPFFNTIRVDSVAAAHAAGLEVNVWTCNTEAEWSRMVSYGVDGIMTDDPAALKQYLDTLQNT